MRLPKRYRIPLPVLDKPDGWSEFFRSVCNPVGCPEFISARQPERVALVHAINSGDALRQRRILEKFRPQNGLFRQVFIQKLLQEEIRTRLDSGLVVEIGAGSGYLTTELALTIGPKGKLVAFEPAKYTADYLNLLLNSSSAHGHGFPRTHVLPLSAGDLEGEAAKAAGLQPGLVDVFIAIRAMHRVRPRERKASLQMQERLLKPGGLIILVELFEDDRPISRKVSRGAWHWYIEQYQKCMKKMELAYISRPEIPNQDDWCQMVAWRKLSC